VPFWRVKKFQAPRIIAEIMLKRMSIRRSLSKSRSGLSVMLPVGRWWLLARLRRVMVRMLITKMGKHLTTIWGT